MLEPPTDMHITSIARAALRVAAALLVGSIAFAQDSPSLDGKWLTKMACPAKGNTEGYTWQFSSVIENNVFRGEHGTAGEPGYLLIEGKIAKDGSAKLTATGIVQSRNYARGVLAHKGEEYSYNIKAKFQDAAGTGTRDVGLGVIGRPCTFDFTKQ